jgi:hypothetical protein
MSENVGKVSGTTAANKPDAGGKISVPYPVKGIVKNTIDANRSGRIQVYVSDFGGTEDDNKSWTTVQYMSPFFGMTPGDNAPNSTNDGTFKTNHHSYGFWATPPDVGSEVVCIFLNGKKDFGYYIGGIPKTGSHHMVPAIGSSTKITASENEADSYGGATVLPVVEWNDIGKEKVSDFISVPRPVHSALAGQLHQQGLLRDPIRGAISSSSMRESPSRVLGLSTPGRPIYKGGLGDGSNDTAIAQGLSGEDDTKLKITARRGGHSLVMDDGDVQGQNQLVRLRTSSGHQITMSDDGQTLFIIHANGQSYVELGKEGTLDIYTMNSFNVRSQGDINFHADNNINIHAEKKLNIYSEEINIQSDKKTNIRVGDDFTQHTVGNHTLKVDKGMTSKSSDAASFESGSATYINGSVVNLNTGSSSLSAEKVKAYNKTTHIDTLFDSVKGWIATPGKLSSIVNRAPAHSPWVNANMGVDVEVKTSADDSLPSPPAKSVQAVNNSTPDAPKNPTSSSVVATVPPAAPVGNIDKSTTQAVVSQQAVSAATNPATTTAVANGSGVVDIEGTKQAVLGKLAQTPAQLEQAGVIKPGSAALADSLIAKGKSVSEALPTNLFTGQGGVNSVSDFVNNPGAQVGAASTLMQNGFDGLKASGVITGNESAGSISGLISSAATNGVEATTAFVKGIGAGLSTTSGAGVVNPLSGIGSKVGTSISEGNFAASLGEKSSSLGDSIKAGVTSAVDSVKSAAAKGFDAVKSVFKKLEANKPVNLNVAAAESDPSYKPPATLKEAVDKIKEKLSGAPDLKTMAASVTGSLPNTSSGPLTIPTAAEVGAGVVAMTAAASKLGVTIPGASAITGLANNLKSLPSGAPDLASLTGIPNTSSLPATLPQNPLSGVSKPKIPTGTTADSVVPPGMGLGAFKDGIASLGSFVNKANAGSSKPNLDSIPKGGENSKILPTFAVDTIDRTSMNASAASLLGGGIALPVTSGGALNVQPLSPDATKQYDTLKKELDDLDKNKKWDLQTEKIKAEKKYGVTSSEYATALEKHKECLKRIEEIRQEMYKLQTG